MKKRFLITEEEKKEIKKLYGIKTVEEPLQEGLIFDLMGKALTYFKNKGKEFTKKIWSKITGEEKDEVSKEDIENLSPEDKQKLEKEIEQDKDEKNKKSNKKDNKTKKEEGNWVTEGRYTYHVPKNYKGNSVHLLFCGNDTSIKNPSNEKYTNNIPKLDGVIFLMTDYRNSLSEAKSFASKTFGGKVNSVAGFSAGGVKVWPLVGDKNFYLIGLIDPTTSDTYSYKKVFSKFGSNTKLVCDPSNWGSYKNTQENLNEYCQNDIQSRGKIICENTSHHGQLSIFYKKFKGMI